MALWRCSRIIGAVIQFGFILMLNLHGCTAKVEIEPKLVSWDMADSLCEDMGFQLFPGRRFWGKDIIEVLAEGQAAWLNGWRVLTDIDQDSNGRVKTLKVDQSKPSDPIPYVCKSSTGDFFTSDDTMKTSDEARQRCEEQGYELATLDTEEDIRIVLDSVETNQPLWLGAVTTQGTFMKQCLAAKKIGEDVKYIYETCNTELNFICFKAPKRYNEFSTLVSKKLTRYADVEAMVQLGATLMQSSTEIVEDISSTVTSSIIPSSVDLFMTTSVITSSELPEITSTVTSLSVTPFLATSTDITYSELPELTSSMTSVSVNAVLPTSSLVLSSESPELTLTMTSSSVSPVLLTSSVLTSTELKELMSTITSSSVNEVLPTSSVVFSSKTPELTLTITSSSASPVSLATSSKLPTAPTAPSEVTESMSPSMTNEVEETMDLSISTSSGTPFSMFPVGDTNIFTDDSTVVPDFGVTELLTSASSSSSNVLATINTATNLIETSRTNADQISLVAPTSTSTTGPSSIETPHLPSVTSSSTYPGETQTTETLQPVSDVPYITMGDHISYTVSSVLQSVALSSSSEPDYSFFDETNMPDIEQTPELEHVPHTDSPTSSEATSLPSLDVAKTTSAVSPESKATVPVIEIKPTATYKQPESTSVHVDIGGGIDPDVEDDTKKDTDDGVMNETDGQSGSVETSEEGVDAGIWVAFIVLIIAVCLSLVIAFILYRRKNRSKPEPMAANGAVPAANETELREKRSKSLSPPRESTTFNDKNYDL